MGLDTCTVPRGTLWSVTRPVPAVCRQGFFSVSTPGVFDNHLERMMGQSAAIGGALDQVTADVRAALIDDTDWTANFATNVDRADIGAGAEVATGPATLGSQTVTNGNFDAADETFTSVSGDGIDSTSIYEHDAIAANAELIVLLDNGGATTPNGNDINVVWAAGPPSIYELQ